MHAARIVMIGALAAPFGTSPAGGAESLPVASAPAVHPGKFVLDLFQSRAINNSAGLLTELAKRDAAETAEIVDYIMMREPPAKPATASRPTRSVNLLLEGVPAAALDSVRNGAPPPESKAIIQRIGFIVLEKLGRTAGDFATAAAILQVRESRAALDPDVSAAFETAVGKMLRRNADLYRSLETAAAATADPILRLHFLGAAGAGGGSEGAKIICKYLGKNQSFDACLLQQIARGGGIVPIELEREQSSRIADYFDSRDPSLRRESALAAGRVRDVGAIVALIQLLRDSEAGVRDAAHWALCTITGAAFRPDPNKWKYWYDRENAWWDSAGSDALQSLTSSEKSLIVGALRELSGHKLFRDAIAAKILPILQSEQTDITNISVAALVSLSSPRALPELVELLDSTPRTRQIANDALKQITGESAGPDKAEWRAILGIGARRDDGAREPVR